MNTNNCSNIQCDINTTPNSPISVLIRALQQPGTHIFLFILFSTVLCWPLISISNELGPYWSVYIYLFVVWSIIIAILLIVSRFCHQHTGSTPPKKEQSQGC